MFDTLLYDCNRYGDTGISVNEHSNPYRYPFAVNFDILTENLHQPSVLPYHPERPPLNEAALHIASLV